MKKTLVFLGILTCIFFFTRNGSGQAPEESAHTAGVGLSVMPGEMVVQNIVPGEPFDLGEKADIGLIVRNQSDKTRSYKIAVTQPSQLRLKNVKGYSVLPDPSWLQLEKDTIEVGPFSQGTVKMVIHVPDDPQYFNQKWAVALSVTSVPKANEKINLRVTPVYYIETVANSEILTPPAGRLGVSPGAINLGIITLGEHKDVAKIKIYNNDTKAHVYSISPFVPTQESGSRKIIVSPNYFWIYEKEWISAQVPKVKIGPKKSKEIAINLTIPDVPVYVKKLFEGLIFIEALDDETLSDFVRVKMNTRKKPKE
ncbi:MAG: hypothetical protein JXD21_02470 [Candidatus Omnitrophica bacterium]|nr:hypothetical protein [Candidatus Omnitrophota bacterium]